LPLNAPASTYLGYLIYSWQPDKGSLWGRILDRTPLFWRFQILGWLGWTLWAMPLTFAHYEDISVAFRMGMLHEALGFLITLGLREIYLRSGMTRIDMWVLAPLIVGISIVAAGLDWLIYGQLERLPGVESARADGAQFSGYMFCLRTLLYVSWSGLYFSIQGLLSMREKSRLLIEAERLRHDAELQMLRSQTNPHFLFNAFNTILSEGRGNPKVTSLVKGLSDYLRYSLACRHEGFVSLGAEIDAVSSYLEVEKARFQGDLVIEIDVTQMARSAGVPGVIVQPLVENAIKYGRETSEMPLRVRIAAETGPHVLRIEICNTGSWLEPRKLGLNEPSGCGLDNLRRRLASIYPDRHRFEIGPRGNEVVALVEIQMDHDYDSRLQNYELRQRMEPS
jgi:two-component system, LytTR family, sensor kinase